MPKQLPLLLLGLLLVTAACTSSIPATPTFDFSILPTITPGPGSEVPPTELLAPTTAVTVEPSGLKVVFVLNGDLWFCSETTQARPLTSQGDAGAAKLSDDGKVIVFTRGSGLWAINNDGSNPRPLVEDLPAFTGHPFLAQFEFQPGAHILYFSSRDSAQAAEGLDLHRVDADAPAPQTLLLEGGVITFSPDGRLLALAQTERIHILRADSPALVSALDFPKLNAHSDWSFYPQVVWLDNSSGFYTVIPGNIGGLSRFLYVSADGTFTAQLAEFARADPRVGLPLIAPDGSKVAYVTQIDSTLEVHVIDASTADLTVATHLDAPLIGLWAWSPDSARFAYHTGDPSRLLIAGPNLPSAPLLLDAIASYSLTWVDANRFLYLANGELRLGQVGNPLLAVIAAGFSDTQDSRAYDFAP
jgi:Tol biopolymer transport system component